MLSIFVEIKLLFHQKYIVSVKNVYLEKGVVTCNIVNSLINVLLRFTAFDDFLPFYFILCFEPNKTFDYIAPKNA